MIIVKSGGIEGLRLGLGDFEVHYVGRGTCGVHGGASLAGDDCGP